MFHHFKKEKLNIAIVLDEYGGFTGIVTKEDVIEEIFGELYDENEEKETDKIIRWGKDEWLIQGDCSFYLLQDHLELNLEHDPRILTIGGYLIEKMGEIPEEGTTLKRPEGTYIIGKVNQNRIEEVVFRHTLKKS
jgi:CBS domain containing-hemolysin-like protein